VSNAYNCDNTWLRYIPLGTYLTSALRLVYIHTYIHMLRVCIYRFKERSYTYVWAYVQHMHQLGQSNYAPIITRRTRNAPSTWKLWNVMPYRINRETTLISGAVYRQDIFFTSTISFLPSFLPSLLPSSLLLSLAYTTSYTDGGLRASVKVKREKASRDTNGVKERMKSDRRG